MDTEYNGYTNRATWNIALWLQNEPRLYVLTTAVENYGEFVEAIYGAEQKTPDGVDYCDSTVNVHELNEMIWDL